MKKRGMSAVVTTLIIILLTIVALGIVWVVVKNLVNKGSEEITLTRLTLDLEIIRANVEGNQLDVTVKRNPGEGNLVGINFVISDGENSVVVRRNTNLQELGWETFSFILSALPVDEITSISVAPIFETSSGKEIIGDVIETTEYEDGEAGTGGGDSATGDPNEDPNEPEEPEEPGECVANQTCLTEGFDCGSFIDDCEDTQNCGDCLGDEECINNVCIPDTCVPIDNATACTNAGYECGILSSEDTCGEQVNCSLEILGTTCVGYYGSTYECIGHTCLEMLAENSGNIANSWPPGTGLYFDSPDLPTDLPGSGYTGYWVSFPTVDNTQCFQIIGYVQDTDVYEYAIAELNIQLEPLPISTGNAYYIWETQFDCISYTPWT